MGSYDWCNYLRGGALLTAIINMFPPVLGPELLCNRRMALRTINKTAITESNFLVSVAYGNGVLLLSKALIV